MTNVAGHLREQNGMYQMILSWKDTNGKRRTKSISTGLPVKGNKKRAESLLRKTQKEFNPETMQQVSDLPVSEYLNRWLRESVMNLPPETYGRYAYDLGRVVVPYFEKKRLSLKALSPRDLETFFRYERQQEEASVQQLLDWHKELTDALQYAVANNWLKVSPIKEVDPCLDNSPVLFTDFITDWLKMMKSRVEITTYTSYERAIIHKIVPYFEPLHYTLQDMEQHPKYIQDFYQHELDRGLTANTVIHYHANIRKCLQYAFQIGMIRSNPADRVERPRKEKFKSEINASRLFSCLYGQPLAVGRVMTPVLAMTVVREAAIAAFTPEKFYTVDLELTSGCTASSRRIPEKSVAENLLEACRKEMVATIQRITRKEKSENPPPLYDLTTLQRDANRLLGYSAQQTLDYVQSLYEKKLTTYPRTDSCYITDDDEEMLEELTEELEGFLDITPEDVDEAVPRTRRTVNREKVTDHHAILPTRSMLQADLDALPKGEQNVLKLIIARTLMAVSKPFRYLETLLTTECAGEEFTAKGKEVLEEGWKAVERKVLADILNRKQELTALPNVAENECGILNAELKEGQTTPPKHFTEDLLLHAMETASADSMPEGVERQGIGTPATRAATIEKLVQKGFLERKGTKKTKVLLPTDKGKALITVMPEEIQSADMTADWEAKLLQIERGEMEPSEFMTEINMMITELVKNTEMKKGANALMKSKIIGVCPNCGKPVVEREKGWFCENRECRFVLWKDNAFFKRLGKRLDAHVADKLLRDGRVRLKDCKSAKGKTYNATVLLSCEADGRSKFSLEFEGGC